MPQLKRQGRMAFDWRKRPLVPVLSLITHDLGKHKRTLALDLGAMTKDPDPSADGQGYQTIELPGNNPFDIPACRQAGFADPELLLMEPGSSG